MQDDTGAYVRPFQRPDGVELYLQEFFSTLVSPQEV